MITISDKTLCCGCTACVTACPAQCIVMRRDREGFDYPFVNSPDLCISCGKCEKVCPMLNSPEEVTPECVYAARVPEYVDGSSSGGVFPYTAEKVISTGGVVYGAVLEDDMRVGHCEASDMEGIAKMRGSKYVQSDMYSTFEEVQEYLKEGRKVLFTGTPCQVAGLNNCLGKPYKGLYTIDFACHGVPAPGLWEKYVKALEKKHGAPVKQVSFRDKSLGWRHYGFRFNDHCVPYIEDPYMALFVQDMTLRPSCYNCSLRNGRSGSDLTLADLWNVNQAAPELNDDKGVSAVFVNTAKGRELIEGLELRPVSFELAKNDNGGFASHVQIPQKREEFFSGVHSADDLVRYMKSYVIRKPFHVRIYKGLRGWLSKVKRRIMG